MATIKEKIKFNYDGRWSTEFGVMHVTTNSSMYEDILVAEREVTETFRKGKAESVLQSVEYAPIEFEMEIAFQDNFTDQGVRDVINWLFKESYSPLYFEGAENRIFYCLPSSNSSITHNGLKNGYVTISMKCNSGFTYSPITTSALIDNTAGGKKTFQITHDGYGFLYPEISLVKKTSAGFVEIRNVTSSEPLLRVSNLAVGENIYINSEKEQIETDIVGTYRYDDLIGKHLRLKSGLNTIEINGACTVQLRYSIKYLY